MTMLRTIAVATLFAFAPVALAQQDTPKDKFAKASQDLQKQLADSLVELDSAMKQIAEEKVPLGRQLRDLESEL